MVVAKMAHAIAKVAWPGSYGTVFLGGLALIILMITVVADVIGRFAFSKSIPGGIEIVGFALIIVFFAGYAYAQRQGLHIQVDVLVGRLPLTAKQVITNSGYLLSTLIMALVGWQFFRQAWSLKVNNVVSGMLSIPEWPFLVIAAFCITLFALTLMVTFFTHLTELLTIRNIKVYLWLLLGTILVLGLFVLSMWPSFLPFKISAGSWGFIIATLLFVLLFLNVHITCVLPLVTFLGLSYLVNSPEAGLSNLSITAVKIASEYTWSVAPLFMWMGLLAFEVGFAKDIYDAAYSWVGHIPGGLASATVISCSGLAAITGSSQTGVLTMGPLALPQMRDYKYDGKLATASICTASTIGALIPPSLFFIVYGMLTEVSIGKLFIAGIFPGILFTGILVAMISAMCYRNPKLGPRGPAVPWGKRLTSLKNVWAVALLAVICIGGIYTGIFTPTEAGAIGVFGAIVIGLALRRLTFKNFISSLIRAVEMTGVIFSIFVFANAFAVFLAITNLPHDLADQVIGLGLPPYGLLVFILLIYMILGCIMNSLPAVVITLPIFFPIVMAAGLDPVWFGVLIVVMVELGQITPPIGMNVFSMSAICKTIPGYNIPMYSIFRGVLPFWGAFIVLLIILVLFPQISLFLPSFM